MSSIRYPVKMINGIPVVRPPAQIDPTNVGTLDDTRLALARRGQATLVINMKKTQLCDSAGLPVLVHAQQWAVAEGGELRLVTRHTEVLRALAVAGVDQMVPIFSRLHKAFDGPPPLVSADSGTEPGSRGGSGPMHNEGT